MEAFLDRSNQHTEGDTEMFRTATAHVRRQRPTTLRRFRFVTPALGLLVAGALVSACGSSTASSTQTPTAAATPTPTAIATPTATLAAGGGSGSFCSQANSVLMQTAQLQTAFAQPGSNTLQAVKGVIGALTQGLDNGDGTAPSAIAAAIHTMRVAYDQVNPGVQAATSVTQIGPAFAPALTTAVKDASNQVTSYYHANCGG